MFTSTFPTLFQTLGPKPNCVWKKNAGEFGNLGRPNNQIVDFIWLPRCLTNLTDLRWNRRNRPTLRGPSPNILVSILGHPTITSQSRFLARRTLRTFKRNGYTAVYHFCMSSLYQSHPGLLQAPNGTELCVNEFCILICHIPSNLWFKICARWL